VLLATSVLFGQQTAPDAAQTFVIDRSRLPQALQQVRLEHLSSGALMLLDHNGDLVHPPVIPPSGQLIPEATTAVTLDPRVGPNVQLGNDPSALPAGMKAQAEPHIARSAINPNFLVAVFQEGRFRGSGAVDCGYSISGNGGLSWSRALIPNLTQASGGTYFRATDPVAGVDQVGNVYLNTLAATDPSFNNGVILVSRSSDGGLTFGAPAVVYQPPNNTVVPDKPWMAINTFFGTSTVGRILATFTLFSNINEDGGSIRCAYSDNAGVTWSAANTINSGVTNAQGSQPIFLANGNLVIVYWNFGTPSQPGERLEAVVSSDGGTSFGSPKLITTAVEYNEPRIRSGSFLPSAATDRSSGNLFVVYQTRLAGNPKIAFTKSTDGGNTWSFPIAISDNPAGSGVFNPAIAASPDGQILTAVFYDHRSNLGSNILVDLYAAQSLDGGGTWLPNFRVSSISTNASLAPLTAEGYMLGDYQGVAEATNANMPSVPVWIDTRTGNPDPFVARVASSPVPSATPTPTPGPIRAPAIRVGVSPGSVREGGSATFTISASTVNPAQATIIHYSMGGTARLGTDYTLTGVIGEVDIPTGSASTTVVLQALTDAVREKNETVIMKLGRGANYRLSARRKAKITIGNVR
jgi:BNR repeat-like domain